MCREETDECDDTAAEYETEDDEEVVSEVEEEMGENTVKNGKEDKTKEDVIVKNYGKKGR